MLALVELDDRSHDRRADRARDRLTARAGYRRIRLPASEYPIRSNVAARIAASLKSLGQVGASGRTGFVQAPADAKRNTGRLPHGRIKT